MSNKGSIVINGRGIRNMGTYIDLCDTDRSAILFPELHEKRKQSVARFNQAKHDLEIAQLAFDNAGESAYDAWIEIFGALENYG